MSPSGKARPGLTAWLRVMQVHHVVSARLEAALREAGLPLTWYEVLIRLRGQPDEPMRMQQLASLLLLTQSGATRLVQQIEQAGLVERRPSPDDLRGRDVRLTSAGLARIEHAIPIFLRAIDTHIEAHAKSSELAATNRALAAILEAHGVKPE